MNKSVKMIMAGVAIAALSASVYARGGDCGDWGGGPMMGGGSMKGGMNIERMQKMHDARMTNLHDKLKLTSKQEAAWKKFAAFDPVRGTNRPDPAEMDKLNAPQRMEKGLERMREMETKMAEHLAVLKEFYAVLTPEQQKVFDDEMPAPGARGQRRGR
ncbi:MAG: Spy/CpxP family protein refolding chaperone [Sideroxydans sp.]|nr:Spy/CpxP family protein refolding chaperone [Sideroxydans sp.]